MDMGDRISLAMSDAWALAEKRDEQIRKAAPDLLAALKEYVAGPNGSTHDRALAAIAKAEA